MLRQVHSDRIINVMMEREVSTVYRDLTEDSRTDYILHSGEDIIKESTRAQNVWQQNRVIPWPQTNNQLKKARKLKQHQGSKKSLEATQNQRLQEIRAKVIQTTNTE